MAYVHKKKHVKHVCRNCKWFQPSMHICCNRDTKHMLQPVDGEMMEECWIRRPGRLPLEVEPEDYVAPSPKRKDKQVEQ